MRTEPVVHLVEPGCRTYLGRFVARCGFLVTADDERRDRDKPVTCAKCRELEAGDDAAIAALKGEPNAAA